jgi:2-keto-myo-inositol isomerase
MNKRELSRREILAGAATACGGMAAAALSGVAPAQAADPAMPPVPKFKYCLNTSTIRGQNLSFVEEIEIAARAGYDSIEPWVRQIEQYAAGGGKLSDLRKRIEDLGLTVESAIGFAQWIIDDDEKRAAALEVARREMDLVRQIGGTRIAAPPSGATSQEGLDLVKAAERYRALLELGDKMEVVPQVELWGFSKTLHRVSEVMFVALESRHPKACVLLDVYHYYKGGNDFASLRLVNGGAMHAIHMNDYPADPPRDKIGDADRVYPGDGVAPLSSILRDLAATGFRGALSIELFNREYWKQDAAAVARTAVEKMRAAVARSLA